MPAGCGPRAGVVERTMLWYYVSPQQERIPVSENRMAALAGSGVLRPTTLLWQEGMSSWVSAGEVKPELFTAPPAGKPVAAGPSAGTAERAGATNFETPGMVQELAGTLSGYATWVEFAGWLTGLFGMACASVGTVIGYFAWQRPERLTHWRDGMWEQLRGLLDQPWWTVAACWSVALVAMFAGVQLMAGASAARRAAKLGGVEEFRQSLHGIGGFFRTITLALLMALLGFCTGLLYQNRPAKSPSAPDGPPPTKNVDRVSI